MNPYTRYNLVQRALQLGMGLALAATLSLGHAAPRPAPAAPEQIRLSVNQLSTTNGNSALLYTVPDGKRLVVTSTFAFVFVGPGERAVGSLAACSPVNCEAFFPYVLSEQATNNGQTNYAASSSTSFYLNAGENLQLSFSRTDGGITTWRVRTTVIGYLEDAPL